LSKILSAVTGKVLSDSRDAAESRMAWDGRCMELNLAGFVTYSTVNGPGKRAVVWVQGCPLRCSGCFNPGFQRFQPRSFVSSKDLAEEISSVNGIEGVTFSGGEPFCQAAALADLGRRVQDHGLNVVTFTGFSYATIRKKMRISWDSLLNVTDLLIAGPYESRLACHQFLLSSSNQELVHISGRLAGRSEEGWSALTIEYLIRPGGVITVTGFPEHRLFPVLSERETRNVAFLEDKDGSP
jgi:anaerobic ribonucleoside-triphosphate reductase activating protein